MCMCVSVCEYLWARQGFTVQDDGIPKGFHGGDELPAAVEGHAQCVPVASTGGQELHRRPVRAHGSLEIP